MTCDHVGVDGDDAPPLGTATTDAHAMRALRGGGHGGGLGSSPEDMYEGCRLLVYARVPLSVNAVLCFVRVLSWLTVSQSMGVITVIIGALYKDVKIFVVFLTLIMLGFMTAMLGLMPTLSPEGAFSADGAFFFPFWAMFGEYGDVGDFAKASISTGPFNWGAIMIWCFNFFAQVPPAYPIGRAAAAQPTRSRRAADTWPPHNRRVAAA